MPDLATAFSCGCGGTNNGMIAYMSLRVVAAGFVAAGLGAHLAFVGEGEVHILLPYSPSLTQQRGYVHAGAVTSILDSACGYAALSVMPPDADVLSIEFKVNMLAPATGESVIARGKVLRAGKTIVVCRADVYARKSGDEKLVAAMQGTMMVARATAGTGKREAGSGK